MSLAHNAEKNHSYRTGKFSRCERTVQGRTEPRRAERGRALQGRIGQGRAGQGRAGQGRAGFLTSSPGSNRVHHEGVWQCCLGINTCCFGMVGCQAIILQLLKAKSLSSTDRSVRE